MIFDLLKIRQKNKILDQQKLWIFTGYYGSLRFFMALYAQDFYQKIHRTDSKNTNFDYLCIFRGSTASRVVLRGNPALYLLDLTSFIQCFLDKTVEICVNLYIL